MRKKAGGSILIVVLWSLSLLAFFSVNLGFGVRQKAVLLDRLETSELLYDLAFSGVETAKGILKETDLTETYDTLIDDWAQNQAVFKDLAVGDNGYFTVSYSFSDPETKQKVTRFGLVDEKRKINLNTADAPTLVRLLRNVAELDEDKAQAVAYAVVDWRDSDNQYGHPDHGAEDSDYENLPLPYGAKDAPFEILDELMLVKDIDGELFDKIKNFVTLYGSGQVNINTAGPEVLSAMGLESGLVDKILAYRRGPDGVEGNGDDRAFTQTDTILSQLAKMSPPLDGTEETLLGNLISADKFSTFSDYFSVTSKGVLNKNGAFIEMQAVIDRKGKIYYLRSSQIQWPTPS